MKMCRTCGQTKPASDFRLKRSSCKECLAAVARAYYLKNRSRILGQQRQRRRSPQGSDAWRRYKYGLSPEEFARMLSAQSGRCVIPHPVQGALVVDHDHVTGAVRGLMCGSCNCGIGLLQDDPDRCEAAAVYLERFVTEGR